MFSCDIQQLNARPVKERSNKSVLKKKNSTVENLTSHNRFAWGWHVVDLRNTKYEKLLSDSVYWKFKKTENLRHRIVQFSIEVFKTACLLINIRKCKKKKKKVALQLHDILVSVSFLNNISQLSPLSVNNH